MIYHGADDNASGTAVLIEAARKLMEREGELKRTVIIAAFAGGWTWWIPLVGVGLMTLYLVNLRRTVRAEQELRARRIRRMKMARLGVRNREDDELGIPQRLRRPGAVVVELDDEDPDFADLAYTDYRFDDDDYDEMPQARVS